MAFRRKNRNYSIDYWPGFVDVLSTLLLLIMFLLSVFVLGQFFLSGEINSKDKILIQLKKKVHDLTDILSLERTSTEKKLESLQASLTSLEKERTILLETLKNKESDKKIETLENALEKEKNISQHASQQMEKLNQNISALLEQIAALEHALQVAEKKEKSHSFPIKNLGERVNLSLVKRMEELDRYRSDFFGRLRTILADHENIEIVGDRFVFQSEILFKLGSHTIDKKGKKQIKKLAEALIELKKKIPDEIHWILRVDGHTDNKPISSGRYKDNWELSSARALSVVRYLIANGVPADHLVAAGFGEFQPLHTKKEQAKNRRIELKITEK